jgi:hypothetical protein
MGKSWQVVCLTMIRHLAELMAIGLFLAMILTWAAILPH